MLLIKHPAVPESIHLVSFNALLLRLHLIFPFFSLQLLILPTDPLSQSLHIVLQSAYLLFPLPSLLL